MRKSIARIILGAGLLTVVAGLSACGLLRSPGIVPPVDAASYGEWVIKEVGTTEKGWGIVATYVPESDEHMILGFDLMVTIDGEERDFFFDEVNQDLHYSTGNDLASGAHTFKVAPAPGTAWPFPTLTIQFTLE